MAAEQNRSGNQNDKGTFPTVKTQKTRAIGFRNTVQALARLPCVVGADWYMNTRNIAALELPAKLFGKARLKSGDTIELASTFFTHCRADRVEWQGGFKLRDGR